MNQRIGVIIFICNDKCDDMGKQTAFENSHNNAKKALSSGARGQSNGGQNVRQRATTKENKEIKENSIGIFFTYYLLPHLGLPMGVEPTHSAWKADILPLNYDSKLGSDTQHKEVCVISESFGCAKVPYSAKKRLFVTT